MKKIGVMLVALIALGFLLTGCGLLNPVKDTVWVSTTTESETISYWDYDYSSGSGGSYKDYTVTTTITNTMSFTKDTVSLKVDATVSAPITDLSNSFSYTMNGTYEYKSGEVIGTLSEGGGSFSFTATVEKDTLTVKALAGSTESMVFTKQK